MVHVGIQKPGSNYISRKIAEFDPPKSYCHALFLFEGTLVCEAHAKFGVRFNRYVPDPSLTDLWRVNGTPEQERAIFEFCAIAAGDGYDFSGVLRFQLGIIEQDQTKYFCSELVMDALETVEILDREVKPWLVSPNRLSLILDESPAAVRDWLEVIAPQQGAGDAT